MEPLDSFAHFGGLENRCKDWLLAVSLWLSDETLAISRVVIPKQILSSCEKNKFEH
jgi:hypothetical protein